MKYMLLIYGNEQAWTEQERQDCYTESIQLTHDLQQQGKFIAASPLQSVTTANSLRIRDGNRLITDGPFAETREQLGGYFLINAASIDDAIEIAARIPAAKKGTVEIRPVVELPNLATPST